MKPPVPSRALPIATAMGLPVPDSVRGYRFETSGDAFALLELNLPAWDTTAAQLAGLTPSELEVHGLLLEGCSNAEIAQRRATAPRTVANQIASIFRKLEVNSRLEVCALAAPKKKP